MTSANRAQPPQSGAHCPQCRYQNPPDSQFCLQCGVRLAMHCPTCGTDLPAGARFCNRCGGMLAVGSSAPAQTPRGQISGTTHSATDIDAHRPATVLFADIVSSTAITERLGAEDARTLLSEAMRLLAAPIEAFGGTIGKTLGDGLLAFFGLPAAHEDDPERAARAALSMQRAMGRHARDVCDAWGIEGFAARIAIHSGSVVLDVQENQAEGQQGYDAFGDTVNTAAHLQALAPPGGILVTDATYRRIQGLFAAEPLGAQQVKGKREPLEVYRLSGELPNASRRGLPGLSSPLVGRGAELQTLRGCLEALGLGRGQLALLVGEPGLGKSRLMHDLRLGTSSDPPRWIVGRCVPYATNTPYALAADVLRSLLGLSSLDPEVAVRLRLRAAMQRLLGDGAPQVLPYLLGLLGLTPDPEMADTLRTLDPQALRQRTFQALRTVLERVADDMPTVLILEDLHWADATSMDFLSEQLLDLPDTVPLLVLLTLRPELHTSSWALRARILTDYPHRSVEIALQPLTAEQSRDLICHLLKVAQLPAAITEIIHARSEGNPFFVEEILRALIDRGLLRQEQQDWSGTPAQIETLVPETLEGVLLSRIDQLDSETRRVLQVAAVIGRTFASRILAHVLDGQAALNRQLVNLQVAELIRELGRIPEPLYSFQHALTRDAAYNTLPSWQRADYHGRVGAALETLYQESLDEHLDVLAYHYSRSRDQERAIAYLRRAADRAQALYANDAAQAYCRELVERMGKLGRAAGCAGIREQLGEILARLARFEEALEVLDLAAQGYRELGDLEGLGRATAQIGRVHAFRGTPEQGIARLTPVLEELAGGPPSAALAALYAALGRLYFVTARFREQLDAAQRAAELARQSGDSAVLAEAEMRRGTALTHLGRQDEGLQVLEEAIPQAEAAGILSILSRALANAATLHAVRGDFARSGRYFDRGLQAAERVGDPTRIAYMTSRRGWLAFLSGNWLQARDYLERAVAMVRDIGDSWVAAHPLGNLAELCLAEGDWDAAAAYLREAERRASRTGDLSELLETRRQLAYLDLLAGRVEQADAELARLGQEPGADDDAALLLPLQAWARLLLGDGGGARGLADAAASRASAERNVLALIEARRMQGLVAIQQERWPAATEALAGGLARAQEIHYPYGEARLLQAHGLLHTRTGELAPARERLQAAQEIFHRLGARRHLGEVGAALAELGGLAAFY